ncbi:asparagine synthase (glutamine-hydrolyzing) [Patescibacteria group bacterium]
MCGINGFNFHHSDLIKKMNKRIRHRGPDQEGIYYDDNFSLGHVRLSIIDLSERGKQPLFNEDKSLALIFNGEIYNFQELRRELIRNGHQFFSQSDSEVVLHLYEDYGLDCLNMLNGIFTFAILNIRKKELFLVRDKIGVKPLYYYFDNSKFIFSSEIKAILEHPIKKEIDLEAFNNYFCLHYIPHPLTIFKNIYKLPPASYLSLKDNQVNINQYWRINDFKNIDSEDEIIEQIQYLMKDSVRRQLISDKPVGIFLSGGIDSTSILGIINELNYKRIKTFSVGFCAKTDHYNFDLQMAKRISQDYQINHYELLIKGQDVLKNIEEVIYHLDEPVSNATQIATFLLAKFAKQEVDVVLGGDGGDELFGGYPRYHCSRLASQWQKLPVFFRENFSTKFLLNYLGKYFKKDNLWKKINTPAGIDRYLLFMSQKYNILEEFIRPNFLKKNVTRDFYQQKYFQSYLQKDFEKYFMLVDLWTWLVNESLMRTDKMTMAFGLEERVPILDYRLVELSAKISSKYKIRQGGKYIFKKAMSRYLPDYVLGAPKHGWFSPIAKWLRTDLRDFAYDILSEQYCQATRDYFNFIQIRNILDDHISKKRYNLICIWTLITFQIWAKQNIEI